MSELIWLGNQRYNKFSLYDSFIALYVVLFMHLEILNSSSRQVFKAPVAF